MQWCFLVIFLDYISLFLYQELNVSVISFSIVQSFNVLFSLYRFFEPFKDCSVKKNIWKTFLKGFNLRHKAWDHNCGKMKKRLHVQQIIWIASRFSVAILARTW